jgi:hypothetical protein
VVSEWVDDFLKAHFSPKNTPPKTYKKGWNEERARQARVLIYQSKPWEKSTGPRTPEGKAICRNNSFRHGRRSKTMRFVSLVLQEIKNME